MVRADAIAAVSTTRRNRDARSLSIFSPNVRAFGSGLVFVVAISTSINGRGQTINQPIMMRKVAPLSYRGQTIRPGHASPFCKQFTLAQLDLLPFRHDEH